MNLMTMGLEAQAASIGKTLADYHIEKRDCPSCHGMLVDSQERRCMRCDATGFVEVRKTNTERGKS